jgi:hypothetical protein
VDEKHANAEAAWLMASRDEGRSWQTSAKIAVGWQAPQESNGTDR